MVRKEIYIFLYIVIIGCNNIENKYVSSLEFEKEYKRSKIMHTVRSYEALFIKNGYVFLKRKEISFFNKNNWSEVLFYTEFNNLNFNIQKEISLQLSSPDEPTELKQRMATTSKEKS